MAAFQVTVTYEFTSVSKRFHVAKVWAHHA